MRHASPFVRNDRCGSFVNAAAHGSGPHRLDYGGSRHRRSPAPKTRRDPLGRVSTITSSEPAAACPRPNKCQSSCTRAASRSRRWAAPDFTPVVVSRQRVGAQEPAPSGGVDVENNAALARLAKIGARKVADGHGHGVEPAVVGHGNASRSQDLARGPECLRQLLGLKRRCPHALWRGAVARYQRCGADGVGVVNRRATARVDHRIGWRRVGVRAGDEARDVGGVRSRACRVPGSETSCLCTSRRSSR